MKHFFILLALVCYGLPNSMAQPTAQFETTFYFEDAAGNRDSVVVGYDTLATRDIDPEFGEEEILVPFDAVFEVRAGHYTWPWSEKLSKKIIERGSWTAGPPPPENCLSGLRIMIYIWSLHQPIKVWWDRPIFSGRRCYRASVLLNHVLDEVAGPISPDEIPPEYVCLAVEDSAYFDLSEEHLNNGVIFSSQRITIEKEVEGLGLQTIYGLRFFPASTPYDYSPCYWVTSTREVPAAEPVLLYPNPADATVYFRLPEGVEAVGWRLFGIAGALLREQREAVASEIVASEVELTGLPAGIYQLLVRGSDGKAYEGRVARR